MSNVVNRTVLIVCRTYLTFSIYKKLDVSKKHLNGFQWMEVPLKLRTQSDKTLAPSFFSRFKQAEYFRLN